MLVLAARTCAFGAALIPFVTAPLYADQDGARLSIETGVSTLGAFIAPSFAVAPNLRIRTPVFLGSVSDSATVNGNALTARIGAQGASVLADYYMGDAGFRISGGLSFGGYDLDGSVTNPTVNGNRYSGNFGLDLQQTRQIAPVVSIGVERPITDRWGYVAELGAVISSMSLTTTGQDSLSAADRSRYDADLKSVNDDLSDIRAIPFASIGVTFNF